MSSPDHNFRTPHDIEGSTYDPYDAVWPEGSRVELGPLFPLVTDEDRRAEWLDDATVAFLGLSVIYTAGSAVHGLAKLVAWLVLP